MHPASRIPLFGARLRLAAIALALTVAGSLQASWWNGEWTLRKAITIDTSAAGAAVGEDLGGFTIPVRLSDANFRFAAAQPDGSDLRFVAADDKTLLSFHVEKFDTLLNEAIVWVRVPAIKASAQTTFWLYYGNASGKAAKSEDAKATYDDQTALVYHFNERGQPANDYSMGGSNAVNPGAAVEGALLGPGLRLDGAGSVSLPATPALEVPARGRFSWSAWIKSATPQGGAEIYARRGSGTGLVIGLDNGAPYVEVLANGNVRRSAGSTPLTPGAWHHLAVVSSGIELTLYLDGEVYSNLGAAVPELNSPAVLGGRTAAGVFVGELDELRIDRAERSAAWIKFSAVTQGPDAAGKAIAIGEDTAPTSWLHFLKTGYVGVIISSLTVDGWLVIGLLAVMSLISWIVMVGKARYVNRVGRANARFLASWSHVATDLSVLDAHDGDHARNLGANGEGLDAQVMRDSSLYRVYHLGVEEIRHRLAGGQQPSEAKVLTARSIQAIRATLDGGLVRETQRLNSSMVLLTIAISGGPFLGLLGTVVGVMITFAAVAQAGDVNVNAIAPGIAAALAATVAGLAVAIPALFGYNYLLTRIKSASNDMHVFIDEFVTKLAEFYSDEVVVSAGPGDPPTGAVR